MAFDRDKSFCGLPLHRWDPDNQDPLPSGHALFLTATDEDVEAEAGPFETLYSRHWRSLGAQPWLGSITHLVVGNFVTPGWDPSDDKAFVTGLLRWAGKMPSLQHLFLGNMGSEECEVSWIQLGDVTPILHTFPKLQTLKTRGNVRLQPVSHTHLQRLIMETGGLPGDTMRAVAASSFPALTHLELWTGTRGYGGNSDVNDVRPILAGSLLPALTHLGIRNCEYADAVAMAITGAPILKQLQILDLSMGTLSDRGGSALERNAGLSSLRRLDLHRHFMSEDQASRLRHVAQEVDVSNRLQGGPDEGHAGWVAVGE